MIYALVLEKYHEYYTVIFEIIINDISKKKTEEIERILGIFANNLCIGTFRNLMNG